MIAGKSFIVIAFPGLPPPYKSPISTGVRRGNAGFWRSGRESIRYFKLSGLQLLDRASRGGALMIKRTLRR